ncbi:MAG: hypothetical protein JWN58_1809 [Gammaproteobacteria bacterium]|nr:hypothetical protein [Gammaproteobacteria bacterium]
MEQIITPGPAIITADPSSSPAKSAASWPSIIAGAFVAVSATLILVTLGSGIGFASVSPWTNQGVSVTTFAISSAIWLILTQWISAGLGGYIAGRLRTRWAGVHTHEVFFRDTAHGLITWAVATVLVAGVLTSGVMSGAGAAGHAAAQVASAGVQGAAAGAAPDSAYTLDKLFRPAGQSTGGSGSNSVDPRTETAHIIANAVATGSVPDADRAYLVDQVAARTGVSQAEAQARVDNFISTVMQTQAKLKAEADAARKAAAQASIYLALSMLIGAFIASVSAAVGGRLRDEHI